MDNETQNIQTATDDSVDKAIKEPLKKSQISRSNNDYLGSKLTRSSLFGQIVVIIVTSIVRGLAMDVFIVPNLIAPGGVSGVASILFNLFGWNVAIINFALNIPLLILAYIYINKYFAVSTAIATALMSIAIQLFDFVPPFTDDVFVAALIGGILNGVALGFLLKINSSTAGTDIIGLLIQNKYPDTKVIWLIFILNAIIAVVNGIVFESLSIVIYSLICVYVCSYAAEILQRGFVSTYEMKIVTKNPDAITQFALKDMHRGVTLLHATGAYTGSEVVYLICVVRKRQINDLKKAIIRLDPTAFFYITPIRETIGNGFDNKVNPESKIK